MGDNLPHHRERGGGLINHENLNNIIVLKISINIYVGVLCRGRGGVSEDNYLTI